MAVAIAGMRLVNPILTASGTCGYGLDLTPAMALVKLGGVVVKGLSLKPRAGNPPPRVVETPAGMLNSIGLQNIGAEAFVRDQLPELRRQGATVIANMFGFNVDQYRNVAAFLDQHDGIAGLEVNISCPNVKEGGIEIGTSAQATYEVIAAVRSATRLPVIAKLTPNVTDITAIAKAAEDAGADALTVINTLVGMSIDVATRKPHLNTVTGGLSGPAIRPVAVAMVYRVAKATSLPIIGCGGIMTVDDVLQFLLAGARAVQVGTANYLEPGIALRLADELAAWCSKNGVSAVGELVGAVKTGNEEAHS